MEGWIKLHRKSIESAAFCNANLWQVWCYCLMRANHQRVNKLWNGEEITIEAGQFLTGRFEGSSDCNMKPSTFRDQLAKLQKMKNLDIKSDNKNSFITIVKWASYQGSEIKPDTTSDNKPTSTRHRQEGKNGRNKEVDSLFELTPIDHDNENKIFKEWNEFAIKNNLPTIMKLSDKRKASVKQRLKEKEFDLPTIYQKISESDYLRGLVNGFMVSFDFIFCSRENYLKILEDKYKNRNGVNHQQPDQRVLVL